MAFTEDLKDPNSAAFKQLETQLCNAVRHFNVYGCKDDVVIFISSASAFVVE
jgi:hypothetical protein